MGLSSRVSQCDMGVRHKSLFDSAFKLSMIFLGVLLFLPPSLFVNFCLVGIPWHRYAPPGGHQMGLAGLFSKTSMRTVLTAAKQPCPQLSSRRYWHILFIFLVKSETFLSSTHCVYIIKSCFNTFHYGYPPSITLIIYVCLCVCVCVCVYVPWCVRLCVFATVCSDVDVCYCVCLHSLFTVSLCTITYLRLFVPVQCLCVRAHVWKYVCGYLTKVMSEEQQQVAQLICCCSPLQPNSCTLDATQTKP